MSLWTVWTVGVALVTLPLIIMSTVIVSMIVIDYVAQEREVDHLRFREQIDTDIVVAMTFIVMTFVSVGLVLVATFGMLGYILAE